MAGVDVQEIGSNFKPLQHGFYCDDVRGMIMVCQLVQVIQGTHIMFVQFYFKGCLGCQNLYSLQVMEGYMSVK